MLPARILIKNQRVAKKKTKVVGSGLLLVDNPAGFTSHDVVAKSRKALGTKKIGHAGTLDPMATGLLVLGVNSGTKLLTFIVGADKTYQATIRLGSSTTTDDAEGEVIFQADPASLPQISKAQIENAIEHFTGVIQQVPSKVSAIKVNGKRAYDLVRAGEEVELKSREVVVSRFQITSEISIADDFIDFDVEVACSSGSYIRALARDIGNLLGVGGLLTALRRTRIGNWNVDQALGLEVINGSPNLISMTEAASSVLPVVEIDAKAAQDLVNGKRIQLGIYQTSAAVSDGRLVAVVEPISDGQVHSLVVFPEENHG